MNKSVIILAYGSNYADYWDEETFKKRALGGTESMLIEMSSFLSKTL